MKLENEELLQQSEFGGVRQGPLLLVPFFDALFSGSLCAVHTKKSSSKKPNTANAGGGGTGTPPVPIEPIGWFLRVELQRVSEGEVREASSRRC